MPYLFIEGCDGVGKSFACDHVLEHLENKGYKTRRLKFPSEDWEKPQDESQLAHRFLVDIASGMLRNCPPDDKTVVVCDRGFVSTIVYQKIKWANVFPYLPSVVLQQKFGVIRLKWPIARMVENMTERGDTNVGIDDSYQGSALKTELNDIDKRYDYAIEHLRQSWLTNEKRFLHTLMFGQYDTWDDVNNKLSLVVDSYFS